MNGNQAPGQQVQAIPGTGYPESGQQRRFWPGTLYCSACDLGILHSPADCDKYASCKDETPGGGQS